LFQGIGEEDDAEKVALKTAIKISMSRQHDETFAMLAFAAKAGDVEMVRQLLRRGAEIDDVDYDGRSVLAMVNRSWILYLNGFRFH
jgi:ankyrin repeat protein